MPVVGTQICEELMNFVAPRSTVSGCDITILGISPSRCVGNGANAVHSITIQVDLNSSGGIIEIVVNDEVREFTVQQLGTNTFIYNEISCTASSIVNEVIVRSKDEPSCFAQQFYKTPVIGSNNWISIGVIPENTQITDCKIVATIAPDAGSPFNLQVQFTLGIPNLTLSWNDSTLYHFRYISGSSTYYILIDVTFADEERTSFSISMFTIGGQTQANIESMFLNNTLIENAASC